MSGARTHLAGCFVLVLAAMASCGEASVWLGAERSFSKDGGTESGPSDDPDGPTDAGGRPNATPAEAGRDAGSGSGGLGSGGAGGSTPAGPQPSWLPVAAAPCPALSSSGTYTFTDGAERSMQVDIRIAPDAEEKPAPGGPLILYWHSLGGQPGEVSAAFGDAAIDAVVERGGVVAAFHAVDGGCCQSEGAGAWFMEDLGVVDQVVACAIERAHIDTRHIHALGFSAGGINALLQAWSRTAYVASASAYSGGQLIARPMPASPHGDAGNSLPTLLIHGAAGRDVVILDFSEVSLRWYQEQRAHGAYTLMCDHGGGHSIAPELAPAVARFFEDHPYKVSPEPYGPGTPKGFPVYCTDDPLGQPGP